MSTPRDLREELVNSLSEGGGGGLRSGGEMGVASLLSPGQPRGEASEAVMRRRLGGDRPQLGSACQATSPGADRLGGGPSVPRVTSETPPEQSPVWPLFLRLGFQSSLKAFQPHSVPLSGPCFPTVEEIQGHPKGPCPAGTLYTTVSEPEAQRGKLTHLRSHSMDGRTTTPAQRSGPPGPAHHPRSSPLREPDKHRTM